MEDWGILPGTKMHICQSIRTTQPQNNLEHESGTFFVVKFPKWETSIGSKTFFLTFTLQSAIGLTLLKNNNISTGSITEGNCSILHGK